MSQCSRSDQASTPKRARQIHFPADESAVLDLNTKRPNVAHESRAMAHVDLVGAHMAQIDFTSLRLADSRKIQLQTEHVFIPVAGKGIFMIAQKK